MATFAKEISAITIEEELKQSYLDYAMSVIVGRALPDVRDGLKPVHRRVLFAMSELGNDWNKSYKKSARIVGDVIGKYHPHGDGPVYDALVRMAQPFSLRYPLVDGQGNFGSVDGDPPAAMRYTEVKLARISHSLLADLEKETVDFVPNYDETEFAPSVLPTRVPNLLINGSSGIAVGMATNIPPHNLSEVINACIALIDNPELSFEEIMQHIPGPDFPTAGIIHGNTGIIQAYKTGHGRLYIRSKIEIETDENNGKQTIVVNELPYQVNKARLIERIAELVKDKKIEGITALRDESDKDGIRVVIELRRGESSDVILNNLFTQTPLETSFHINMVALVDGRPQVMNIRDVLRAFLRHRREVVTRRTLYELKKARERAHTLEGLGIALVNIEAIIALIKASSSPAQAKERLLAQHWEAGIVATMLQRSNAIYSRPLGLGAEFGFSDAGYRLSAEQAQAILDLRLHRLTGLEQEKIMNEYQQVLQLIDELMLILSDPQQLLRVIRDELLEIKSQFGDARRTEIIVDRSDFCLEDLINEENLVVTLSREGYIKSQSLDMYRAQRRGGKGKTATSIKDEDFIERLLVANSHDTILCFSNHGKVYWLKVYEVPQASRIARGKPIVNILPLAAEEHISAILPIREYTEGHYIFMATAKGTVKKVGLTEFSRPRSNGLIALELLDGDQLIGVDVTHGDNDVALFTDAGKCIRFHETEVRSMGRQARGVRGVNLKAGQKLISLVVIKPDGTILTVTKNGYGKRTAIDEYRCTGRGGQGVISIQVSSRNGLVVGAVEVFPGDEVMLISDRGTLVRTRVDEISVIGRNTQGVRLINLDEQERLVGIQRIEEIDNGDLEIAVDDVEEDNADGKTPSEPE